MIGDNLEWEVAAPQRLGITSIWFDPLQAGLPANSAITPDHTIHRLESILTLFDK